MGWVCFWRPMAAVAAFAATLLHVSAKVDLGAGEPELICSETMCLF